MAKQIITVTGTKQITAAFGKLPKEFSTTKRKNISKKALKPFISRAKQKAPVDTGSLEDSIGIKVYRNNPNFVYAGVVKKRGKKRKGKDPFYAKFIEFGFTQIAWPEKGESRKRGDFPKWQQQKIEAKPFILPAWDETKDVVRRKTTLLIIKRIRAFKRKQGL